MKEPEPVAATERRISLTPSGQFFMLLYIVAVILVLPLGGGAKLLAATLLAFLLIGMATAWINLLSVRCLPAPTRRAGSMQPFALPITLVNRSRWRWARDLSLFHGDPRSTSGPPDGFQPILLPRHQAVVETIHKLGDRGRHRHHEVTVCSSYPFGLVQARATYDLPAELIILPRVGTFSDRDAVSAARSGHASMPQHARRGDDDFYGLRAFRDGMNRKLIHWKATARQSRPIAKELHGEDRPPVQLVLSPFVEKTLAPGQRHGQFEVAVSLTATLAELFLASGQQVRITLAGPEPSTRISKHGRRALHDLIEPLADVEPAPVTDPPTVDALLTVSGRGDEFTIVVHASGLGANADTPVMRRHGSTMLLDACSSQLHRIFSRGRSRTVPERGRA